MKLGILALFCALFSVALVGCLGNSSTGNEIIVQPKRLIQATPMLCPDRQILDVSLGVMRNGVGSMSTQDMALTLSPDKDSVVNFAIGSGSLLRIKYDDRRFKWCAETELVTAVEVVRDSTAKGTQP